MDSLLVTACDGINLERDRMAESNANNCERRNDAEQNRITATTAAIAHAKERSRSKPDCG
jgi:hypothetical protein